jgi:hypothetical protein
LEEGHFFFYFDWQIFENFRVTAPNVVRMPLLRKGIRRFGLWHWKSSPVLWRKLLTRISCLWSKIGFEGESFTDRTLGHGCIWNHISGAHPSLQSNGYPWLFPRGGGGLNGRGVKLSTHLHLAPWLETSGAILPLPHTYHGMVLGQHWDNFTFYLYWKVKVCVYRGVKINQWDKDLGRTQSRFTELSSVFNCHLRNQIKRCEWAETRRCFIAIAFQFCFRICRQESQRKSTRFGIEWDTSAIGPCWRY